MGVALAGANVHVRGPHTNSRPSKSAGRTSAPKRAQSAPKRARAPDRGPFVLDAAPQHPSRPQSADELGPILRAALDFIDCHVPPKPCVPEPRTFIGEVRPRLDGLRSCSAGGCGRVFGCGAFLGWFLGVRPLTPWPIGAVVVGTKRVHTSANAVARTRRALYYPPPKKTASKPPHPAVRLLLAEQELHRPRGAPRDRRLRVRRAHHPGDRGVPVHVAPRQRGGVGVADDALLAAVQVRGPNGAAARGKPARGPQQMQIRGKGAMQDGGAGLLVVFSDSPPSAKHMPSRPNAHLLNPPTRPATRRAPTPKRAPPAIGGFGWWTTPAPTRRCSQRCRCVRGGLDASARGPLLRPSYLMKRGSQALTFLATKPPQTLTFDRKPGPLNPLKHSHLHPHTPTKHAAPKPRPGLLCLCRGVPAGPRRRQRRAAGPQRLPPLGRYAAGGARGLRGRAPAGGEGAGRGSGGGGGRPLTRAPTAARPSGARNQPGSVRRGHVLLRGFRPRHASLPSNHGMAPSRSHFCMPFACP